MIEELQAKWSASWQPEEPKTLSEWAESELILSPEYSRQYGRTVKLFGWQKQIFDAFTDDSVRGVVTMCSTQLVKTLLIQAAAGYAIAKAPGPILIAQPGGQDAKDFSRERIAPMIRDCPTVGARVSLAKSRDSKNTILQKVFDGGTLNIVGTRVPGNLARRAIRYFFADEIDKYVESSGKEGDPLTLGLERMTTYESLAKFIFACSPTIRGASRIEKEFLKSDQRKPFVKCPKCKAEQVLAWKQVQWDSSKPIAQQAETAMYRCEHCTALWGDVERWAAAEAANFKPTAPFTGVAGFWISHLYSPWKTLGDIVGSFLAKKGNKVELKAFVNTTLAELWEEEGEQPDHVRVYANREDYAFGPEAIIPDRAYFLTAGVDVQADRIEVETVAWAPHRESWSIDYSVLQAFDQHNQPIPTTRPDCWELLAEYLNLEWEHESGSRLPILAMGIDTGHQAPMVYRFARKHPQPVPGPAGLRIVPARTVVCVKGADNENEKPIKLVSSVDAAAKRFGIKIVTLGTGYLKQQFYDSLKTPRPSDPLMPAHGVQHFPGYNEAHFRGLTSEKRVVHANGDITWEKLAARNEALDCRVYASGAAVIVGVERMVQHQWDGLRRRFIHEGERPASYLTSQNAVTQNRESSVMISGARSLKDLFRPIPMLED